MNETLLPDQKDRVFTNDAQYIEACFRVCALFQKKRTLIAKLKELDSKEQSAELIAAAISLRDEIKALNQVIRATDRSFRRATKTSLNSGRSFVAENIAAHLKLNLFEKRMFLFFLYLEFYVSSNNLCVEDELLNILDLDDSIVSKMRRMISLTSDSALIREGFIVRENSRGSSFTKLEYALSDKAITLFAKMLNGQKPEWEREKTVAIPSCGDVGFIKDPEYTLADVVLKEEIKDKVRLFLDTVKGDAFNRFGVYEKIKKGTGLTFLFYGPPGTGKSMLAEAIASYINKKVLVVQTASLMSKFQGDTDKNIANIFKQATDHDLVVILDEADSLLYNRGYAQWEHDIRFVNVMLQELERFKGIIVLTTNMEILLDQALERRLALKVKFELPEKNALAGIWSSHIPSGVSLSQDVDFNVLARKYIFSGGNVKNAILNSLRRVASRQENVMSMDDLTFGANMEQEGMFTKNGAWKICGFAEGG